MDKKPIDDGGPAYPGSLCANCNDPVEGEYVEGMTLRDWFAGMAMQGLCANKHTFWDSITLQGSPLRVAEQSFIIADAMIKERKQ